MLFNTHNHINHTWNDSLLHIIWLYPRDGLHIQIHEAGTEVQKFFHKCPQPTAKPAIIYAFVCIYIYFKRQRAISSSTVNLMVRLQQKRRGKKKSTSRIAGVSVNTRTSRRTVGTRRKLESCEISEDLKENSKKLRQESCDLFLQNTRTGS